MIDWREFCGGIAIAAILLLAMFLLSSCAGQPFQAICGVQPIGQTEAGIPYFAISCEPQK